MINLETYNTAVSGLGLVDQKMIMRYKGCSTVQKIGRAQADFFLGSGWSL